jgi:UDP-N-acetylglucosamine 2-epimerase (non-hydrolysing)
MRTLFVIGTRPEAIKLFPVINTLRRESAGEAIVVSTGQHREMLDQMFDTFGVEPDVDLAVMEPDQTPTGVMATVLARIDPVLRAHCPDWVVVQGDTTTVAAVAIAAFYARLRVAHVEAGLRTDNRWQPFPEEINRRLASVVADLHFAPTTKARQNLVAENISPDSIEVTGNTVIDALAWALAAPPTATFRRWKQAISGMPDRPKVILLTAHRRESIGAPLEAICEAVSVLCANHGDRLHVVYPVHRNPAVMSTAARLLDNVDQVTLLEPLDYVTMVKMMNEADLILTDSGGIQEEAPSLGKPVLVLRNVTERSEGIAAGTAKLVGTSATTIVEEVESLLVDEDAYARMANAVNPYGDGRASERIVASLIERHRSSQ